MPGHTKTERELRQELAEQVHALRDSATAYDAGKRWEAKRLAATAYILLHDGGQRPLLKRFGLLRQLRFISTVKPKEIGSPLPLAYIQGNFETGAISYEPFLDVQSTHQEDLKFSQWYNQTVFAPDDGLSISRKALICALRNQMGGGHVDGEVKDDAVFWLTRGAHSVNFGSWVDKATGLPAGNIPLRGPTAGPVPNGHLATMRQIAWELDRTLSRAGF